MRIPKFWRKGLLWGFLGLMVSLLIGCQGSAPTASGPGGQPVEFWTMQLQPKYTPYFTQLISRFSQDQGGKEVKWIDVPWEAMESKILTAVSANTAPDVVNLNPKFASQLAAKKAWLNFNEVLSPEVKAQYLPNIWQANTLDDTTFGLPWYLTTRITIYNQDLFQKAGLKNPPATYAELAKVARAIKDKTGKYAFFITFSPSDSAEVLESLVQMGVKLVDDQGKAAFNSPAGKAAFQYWVDLYQQGLLPPEVLTQGHRYAVELYQAGSTAVLASGAEFLASIETNAPSIAKVSAAAPQITGQTQQTNVAVMNLVIPRNSKNQEAAVQFAQFVTNAENQLVFAKEGNVLPSNIKAVEQYIQDLEKDGDRSTLAQARQVSARQLKTATVLIPPMKNLNLLQKAIYENLGAAMLKQKSVDQALQDAAQAWNEANV
ncbi:sugar ABC transporter substrate-binding protein [Synechocystis sp. LKSZ1]|uniref:ABC transporter substrate-binding protein n=1 Tax=Synechocystis sp. LKSZ1 TaxID=3144951 RepID=UPI00336BC526